VNEWEMPKETAAGSSKGGLVYLRYTFRYRSQFDESNGDWLEAIEATSDELLGAYKKEEDEAMTVAFGARGKRGLNRVFDVIRFVYPDYCFPVRKQGGKRKIATSTSSSAPKPDSRLEGGGVNRAKLKFSKIITTKSRVSVRNIIESTREGGKQIASE
jgi:hypothetical protein